MNKRIAATTSRPGGKAARGPAKAKAPTRAKTKTPAKPHAKAKVKAPDDATTRALLDAVAADPALTQRRAALALAMSLGRVNAHLKQLEADGLIVAKADGRTKAYTLTARGRQARHRLRRQHLEAALTEARAAREDIAATFAHAATQGWTRIAMAGLSGLCDAAILAAQQGDHETNKIELVGIIDVNASVDRYLGLAVGATAHGMGAVHAVLITDITDPDATFADAVAHFPRARVLTPALLGVKRGADETP